jgi:adenylate cyclase
MKVDSKRIKSGILIACSVSLLTVALFLSGRLVLLEEMTYDSRMTHSRSDKSLNENIIVLLIDEPTLQVMNPYVGRWPWSRSVFANVIDLLSENGAKSVVFDILFTENELASKMAGLSESDQSLVSSTQNSHRVVHAAQLLHDSSFSLFARKLPSQFVNQFSVLGKDIFSVENTPQNNDYYLPFSELFQVADGVGDVEFSADVDGVYRRTLLFRQYNEHLFPALSIAPLMDDIKQNRLSLPATQNGQYLINYYGKYNAFSLGAVLAATPDIETNNVVNPVDLSIFKNKIVFIGASAEGLDDVKKTPLSKEIYSVFMHASIASNILEKDFLLSVDKVITILSIIGFSLLTALVMLIFSSIIVQVLMPVTLAFMYVQFTFVQFELSQVFQIVAPVMAISVTMLTVFIYLAFSEGRDRAKVRKMLSSYVSPSVLSQVDDNVEDILRADRGKKEYMTILFSDIRNFTSLSEKLAAESVVEMLNIHLSAMSDVIFKHKGTLDKFIGDATMAFWGAPIKDDFHCKNTLLAAIDMVQKMQEVNETLRAKGHEAIRIGVGLSTGDVVLGNIGSERKLDYTVVGDAVNVASRMEGLTKVYGVSVVLSEMSYYEVENSIPCGIVDMVRVKGKDRPVRIYTPLIFSVEPSENERKIAEGVSETMARAFGLYTDGCWRESIELYRTLPEQQLGSLAKIFIQRCELFELNGVDDDWDGIYKVSGK